MTHCVCLSSDFKSVRARVFASIFNKVLTWFCCHASAPWWWIALGTARYTDPLQRYKIPIWYDIAFFHDALAARMCQDVDREPLKVPCGTWQWIHWVLWIWFVLPIVAFHKCTVGLWFGEKGDESKPWATCLQVGSSFQRFHCRVWLVHVSFAL